MTHNFQEMFMRLLKSLLAVLVLSFSTAAWCADKGAPLLIAAPPNPNVFPLLVALEENPDLPVRLLPVADNKGIDAAFKQGADGLLAMTYTSAEKAASGKIPDLELQGVYYWRGFFEMTVPEVHGFADLRGKGLIVSGPVSGGRGGGPDHFFQAALKRSGFTPGDFNICYLPVKRGLALLDDGKPMNTEKACGGQESASGILLVEPAASGLLLKSAIPFAMDRKVHRAIDLQKLFGGYKAWGPDELPHGGFAIRRSALENPARKAQIAAFVAAYKAAVDRINASDGMFSRMRLGWIISKGMEKYYGQFHVNPSAMVVARAIENGEMRFRTDRPMSGIRADLDSFLKEVLGGTVPATFYPEK